MALNDKPINFDINKNNLFNLIAKQYDTTGARSFTFRLLKGSIPFDLTGLSVKVGGKKPDGKDIFNSCTIKDAKKGIVELELTTQMQGASGMLNLELIILKGEARLSTIPFEVEIIKSVTDFEKVESSSEFGALQEALWKTDNVYTKQEVDSKTWAMSNMGQDVKEAMTGGSVAVVGENAILNENIVDRQIDPIKLANAYEYFVADNGEHGVLGAGGEVVHSPGIWSTPYIPVKEGEKYIFQCRYNGKNALPFICCDKNKEILYKKYIKANDMVMFIPQTGVAYIRLSIMDEDKGTFRLIPLKLDGVDKLDGTGLIDRSVSLSSLSFISPFNNLIDTYNLRLNGYIDTDGSFKTLEGVCSTDYIPIMGGRTYYTRKEVKISVDKSFCMYDKNKNCLNKLGLGVLMEDGKNIKFTLPVECSYIKLNSNMSTVYSNYIVNDLEKISDNDNNEILKFTNRIGLNETQIKEVDKITEELVNSIVDKNINLLNTHDPDYLTGYYYNTGYVKTPHESLDTSGFIKVNPGEIYTIKKMNQISGEKIGWYFDIKLKPIRFIVEESYTDTSRKFTIPEGVEYIRVHVNENDKNIAMLVKNGIYPVDYQPYGYTLKDTVTIKRETNNFKGLKFNFMGDSITAGVGTTKTYHSYLSDYLGIIARNYGIAGSRISDGSNPMHSRVTSMDSDADYVFVFGGTNDFNGGVPLGTLFTETLTERVATNDTTTFYGALHTLCVNLINKYPSKKLVLITPLHRELYEGQKTDLQKNSKGNYLVDYVNAIKEIGKWYSIPVLDLYSVSGLNPNIQAQKNLYFSENDGLHPKSEGHRVIAYKIKNFLKTI